MTTPTVLPTGFAGDDTDFLKAVVDRQGVPRLVQGTVAIPTSLATASNIGLHPFRKGARLCYDTALHITDVDSGTNVTLDVGYVYDDDASYSNDTDAFVDGSTAPQTGGFILPTGSTGSVTGMTFVAEADGWFVAQNNVPTTTAGTLTFNMKIAYDG